MIVMIGMIKVHFDISTQFTNHKKVFLALVWILPVIYHMIFSRCLKRYFQLMLCYLNCWILLDDVFKNQDGMIQTWAPIFWIVFTALWDFFLFYSKLVMLRPDFIIRIYWGYKAWNMIGILITSTLLNFSWTYVSSIWRFTLI